MEVDKMNFGFDIEQKSAKECVDLMKGLRTYLEILDRVDSNISDLFKYSYYMDTNTDTDLVQFHTFIQMEIKNQEKILKKCEQKILEADRIDKQVDENILYDLELLLGKLIVNHQIENLTKNKYEQENNEKIYSRKA